MEVEGDIRPRFHTVEVRWDPDPAAHGPRRCRPIR